jgi:hypothetical protein
MRLLLAVFQLFRGIGHLLRGMFTIATRFPKASAAQRGELIADWWKVSP